MLDVLSTSIGTGGITVGGLVSQWTTGLDWLMDISFPWLPLISCVAFDVNWSQLPGAFGLVIIKGDKQAKCKTLVSKIWSLLPRAYGLVQAS